MTSTKWGDPIPHDGSPDCPEAARDVPCMVKGPEWEEWRTVDAHADHTDQVYWPNVTAYRLPIPAPDVTADLVAALRPFDACVFKDNGDVTISTGDLTVMHWLQMVTALTAAKEKLK